MPKQKQQGGWRATWLAKLGGVKNGDQVSPFFWLSGLMMLGLVIVLVVLLPGQKGGFEEQVEAVEEEITATGPRHPLSGRLLEEEEVIDGVYAVVVENSTDARPQSGIEEALIVFEAPVEGNITRWMALYGTDQEVDEIGPVRSARPYFVNWALGWDALFAHVGGSPEALEMIDRFSVSDLNEFFWSRSFWRSANRYAPHNTYTETDRLARAWEEIIDSEIDLEERQFTDTPETTEDPHEGVEIIFGNRYYDVDWRYDTESGRTRAMTALGRIEPLRGIQFWQIILQSCSQM